MTARVLVIGIAVSSLSVLAAPAAATCTLVKLAELPVSENG